ncbi:MAG TPA: hypothetical protein VNO81_06700 [Candidatus Nitrosotenuis sp.]|nr:hypothetical protein [Candidatus Nitrosotenuis sp.]
MSITTEPGRAFLPLLGLATVLLDTGVLWALSRDNQALAVLLFHLAVGVGGWGAVEALHWMGYASPWRRPAPQDLPGSYLGSRLEGLRHLDRAAWRACLLRLSSGAGVALLALMPALLTGPPGQTLPPTLHSLALLQLLRLLPLGAALPILAPLLYFWPGLPARASDRLHAGLAAGCSAAALLLLCRAQGACWELVGRLAMLVFHHPYGLMVGGLVWWGVARAGRTPSAEE